jgi:DNA-binding LytR/AlgR family response regulator
MNNRPRILIADDEAAPREQLAEALAAAWPEAEIVALAEHGVDAWDAWLAHEPEAAFLDIRMPGLTGIEVAQRIAGRCPVVFVTAYGDHALSAFEAGAVDYLVKPVDPQRLSQAVARVRERLRQPAAPEQAQALQALLAQLAPRRPAQPETLQASVGKEVRLIRLDDVIYLESDTRYTRVVTADQEALIRTPLKELLAGKLEDLALEPGERPMDLVLFRWAAAQVLGRHDWRWQAVHQLGQV